MFLILILIIILDIITALELIFKYRRSIQSTISWVLLLVLFPIGGFVLYNLFGRGLKKSRKFKLKKEEDIAFRDNFLKNEFSRNITNNKKAQKLIYIVLKPFCVSKIFRTGTQYEVIVTTIHFSILPLSFHHILS